MKIKGFVIVLITFLAFSSEVNAQRRETTVRERPAEWDKLVFGGRFIDLFLPMPDIGKLTKDTWGAANPDL